MTPDAQDLRKPARFDRLRHYAQDTISEVQLSAGATTPTVELDEDLLGQCVDWHFHELDAYKEHHDFLDGFANFGKIAAFTALAIKNIRPLVPVDESAVSTNTYLANTLFARNAVYAILFIDPDSIPIEMDEIFMHALHYSNGDVPWMIMACDLFHKQHRNPKYINLIEVADSDPFSG